MKRKFLYLLLTLCLLGQCLPAFAAQAPVLERIAFSGATIVGQFKSDVYQYQLVLDNAAVSPKLKSYKVQGEGNLFVTYDTDSTNHQTAVVVTLSYDTGSAKYTFTYKNAAAYVKNSENHLDSITCTLGELVPEMNEDDTTYKLYIPGDLTSLMITPVTKDINAYCAPVEMTLAPGSGDRPDPAGDRLGRPGAHLYHYGAPGGQDRGTGACRDGTGGLHLLCGGHPLLPAARLSDGGDCRRGRSGSVDCSFGIPRPQDCPGHRRGRAVLL